MSVRAGLVAVAFMAVQASGLAAQPGMPTPSTPLTRLVAEALQNNPEIAAARREEEAAQQRVRPAAALDDPMLEAGFVNLPARSLDFAREDMTMKMVGLSQRLPYPGKLALREQVAVKDAEAASYAVGELVNRVKRDVEVSYFDLALTVESARITENSRRALEQLAQVAQARYDVGQASQADVLKAQTQLSRMTDDLIRLERERRMGEAELLKLLGAGDDPRVVVPELPSLREATVDTAAWRDAIVTARPELRGLRAKVERSDSAVELARKDYYPDFDVRFQYGQRDKTPSGERREDMISLTVAVNLPIWGGAKQGPRVAEALAMREQAARMYDARRNEILAQLRQQVAVVDQSYRSARLYEDTVLPQARLAVESSLASYRVNRVDFLTLLDNQMAVYTHEISYATAIVSENKALAEIEFITAGASNVQGK